MSLKELKLCLCNYITVSKLHIGHQSMARLICIYYCMHIMMNGKWPK